MIERRATEAHQLRALFELGTVADLSDGELLDRFVTRTEREADLAFEALVARHGGLVLSACRRLLRDPHDADDAFQATFLVLASRARAIRGRDSVASWLYGVALRVASNARRARTRRQVHERQAALVQAAKFEEFLEPELTHAIAEELGRLPDRFRAAVILCDLEGLSHEEAAQRLGCPLGTLKSRQARGRDRLKGLLARRGFAPSVAAIGLASLAQAASACLPESLMDLTLDAASRMARGKGAASLGSATVAALTKGTLTAMFLTRIRLATTIVLLLGAVSIGTGVALRASAARLVPKPVAETVARDRPVVADKPDRDVLREAARAIKVDDEPRFRFYGLIEIAKAQTRAEDRDGARETLQLAIQAAKSLEAKTQSVALLTASWACDEARDQAGSAQAFQLARTTVDELTTTQEILDAWPLFAAAQADRGDRDGAKSRLDEIARRIEAMPSKNEQFFAALSVAGAMSYIGDYQAAFQLAARTGATDDYMVGKILGAIADHAASEAMYYQQPRRKIAPQDRQSALEVLRKIEQICERFSFADQRADVELATSFSRLGISNPPDGPPIDWPGRHPLSPHD